MNTKSFACAAVAAVVMAGLAPKTLAGVPSGNLPLLTDGLVVHLDASDTSTMTLDDDSRVLEWRSKVGTIKFAKEASQNVTNLPYWKESINVPSTAKVPGVVFGVVPGYEYTSSDSQAGAENCVRTMIKATESVSSKEVFLVMVNHPRTAGYGSATVEGAKVTMCSVDGYFFQTGGTPNRSLYMYGNNWSVGFLSADGYLAKTGLAWLNGTKVVDWPNGIYETNKSMHGFRFSESTLHLLDSVGDTSVSNEGVPVLGRNDYNAPSMDVCEVAIYNRVLTDEERAYVTLALCNKWKNKTEHLHWTGAGDGKSWTDGANWSSGKVPSSTETAIVEDAQVTVSGDVACGGVIGVDTEINIAENATFAPGEFAVGSSACAIIGTGKLKSVKASKGRLALRPSVTVADTLTLNPTLGGVIDLNGCDVSCAALVGGGLVTNSSATAATLEVEMPADGAIDAALMGNLSLKKSGAGIATYPVPQTYTGATVVAGGALVAVTNYNFAAIPGVQFHLDATRTDTITLDQDGCVTNWCSTTDPTIQFKVLARKGEYSMGGNWVCLTNYPLYQATGINGKMPCVRFSWDEAHPRGVDGYTMLMGLKSGTKNDMKSFTHRTMIIAHRPRKTGGNNITPYGRYLNGYVNRANRFPLINYYSKSDITYGNSVWGAATNEVYINAKKVYDKLGGQTPTFVDWGRESTTNGIHVLTVTIPEGVDDSLVNTEAAVIGCGWFCAYDDNGKWSYQQYAGDICEAVLFDRYLPDAERRGIETYLMEKWGNAANTKLFNPGARQFANAPASTELTIDAQGGTTLPCLTTIGGITLTDITLNLMNVDNAKKATILSDDTAVMGPFESVTGLTTKQKLVYKAKEVIFRVLKGFTAIIR